MSDYLNQEEVLSDYYNNFPNIEGFGRQLKEKSEVYSLESRRVLCQSLTEQKKNLKLSDSTKHHLKLLEKPTTFTVTTGHQLNLFTGPLYFLYKIISAINLAKQLKINFPTYDFVPVYWMATEDHDFEEISFFNFKQKKISWNKEVSGAVGRTSTEGLNEVFNELNTLLGNGLNADRIRKLYENAYLNHDTLTEATRYLANELFTDHGLLIIDGDDKNLKALFAPFVKQDLLEQTCFKEVISTNQSLESNYSIQVNPREVNLFYLDKELRERIVFEDDLYKINNTDIVFTEDEMMLELDKFPEKFSPNVLMRPLYQEVVLPNLCYIGGGGEMAYWLQLKGFFERVSVPFPILLLRNSVVLINEKQSKKLKALNISNEDIFLDQNELVSSKIKKMSELKIDFSSQRNELEEMFSKLKRLSDQTDKSFTGAVLAQEKKQLNGLGKLEKRLLQAQKRKYKEIVSRIVTLQDELFPKRSLQERQANFSEFYEIYGAALIPLLIENLDPLQLEFDIVRP